MLEFHNLVLRNMEKYIVVFEREFQEDESYKIQMQTNSLVKAVAAKMELESCNDINTVKILEVREVKMTDKNNK